MTLLERIDIIRSNTNKSLINDRYMPHISVVSLVKPDLSYLRTVTLALSRMNTETKIRQRVLLQNGYRNAHNTHKLCKICLRMYWILLTRVTADNSGEKTLFTKFWSNAKFVRSVGRWTRHKLLKIKTTITWEHLNLRWSCALLNPLIIVITVALKWSRALRNQFRPAKPPQLESKTRVQAS